MKRETIENIINELHRHHAVFEEGNMYEALFEYACVSCYWTGINHRIAPDYVHKLMVGKAREIQLAVQKHYRRYPTKLVRMDKYLQDLSVWEGVVRKEHGGGAPVGYDNEQNRNKEP